MLFSYFKLRHSTLYIDKIYYRYRVAYEKYSQISFVDLLGNEVWNLTNTVRILSFGFKLALQ